MQNWKPGEKIILFGEQEVLKILINFLQETGVPSGGHENRRPGHGHDLANQKETAEGAEDIRKALQETHWNRKEAAKILQISYKALLYKIKKYRLNEVKNPRKFMEELEWPMRQSGMRREEESGF
jgi:DNA-binding NtrC family response regulator